MLNCFERLYNDNENNNFKMKLDDCNNKEAFITLINDYRNLKKQIEQLQSANEYLTNQNDGLLKDNENLKQIISDLQKGKSARIEFITLANTLLNSLASNERYFAIFTSLLDCLIYDAKHINLIVDALAKLYCN